MSAKQSALLVARARKRRRDREELRARCGVFNDDPGDRNAPDGWVEIQRNDTIDREFGDRIVEVFESDEHAACAVARAGGGGALLFDVETGATLLLDRGVGAEGTTLVRADVRRAIEAQIAEGDDENDGTSVRWICIVPRSVAKAAGLDCEDE